MCRRISGGRRFLPWGSGGLSGNGRPQRPGAVGPSPMRSERRAETRLRVLTDSCLSPFIFCILNGELLAALPISYPLAGVALVPAPLGQEVPSVSPL